MSRERERKKRDLRDIGDYLDKDEREDRKQRYININQRKRVTESGTRVKLERNQNQIRQRRQKREEKESGYSRKIRTKLERDYIGVTEEIRKQRHQKVTGMEIKGRYRQIEA